MCLTFLPIILMFNTNVILLTDTATAYCNRYNNLTDSETYTLMQKFK